MTETIVALGGVVVILAGALVGVVKQRKNGHGDEMRDDVKDIRRNVHGIRTDLQAVITKVAVLEHRVGDLERDRR